MSVPDLDAVRARLRELGAEPHGSMPSRPTRSSTPRTARSWPPTRGCDCGRTRDDESSDVDSTSSPSKARASTGSSRAAKSSSCGVANDDDAIDAAFAALGYSRVLSFEKRRESWKLGGCNVELDELPHLGTFVEIEGPERSGHPEGPRAASTARSAAGQGELHRAADDPSSGARRHDASGDVRAVAVDRVRRLERAIIPIAVRYTAQTTNPTVQTASRTHPRAGGASSRSTEHGAAHRT